MPCKLIHRHLDHNIVIWLQVFNRNSVEDGLMDIAMRFPAVRYCFFALLATCTLPAVFLGVSGAALGSLKSVLVPCIVVLPSANVNMLKWQR